MKTFPRCHGQRGAGTLKGVFILIAAVVLAPLLVVGFYEGRKAYWDAKVRELCAKDGGIKVYEKVELPEVLLDKNGVIRIPDKRHAKVTDQFYYDQEVRHLNSGNPDLWRIQFRILRQADSKLLGMAVSYVRRGGDLPGPWHESSFICPSRSDISDMKTQVFVSN
ncbi:MAG: hypothetical protein ACYC5U_01680 [Rhodocyclaceae bacterium]